MNYQLCKTSEGKHENFQESFAMLQRAILFKYLIQHTVQLIPSLNYTITIIAVDNKDKPLSILEVVSPQRSDLNVPKTKSLIETMVINIFDCQCKLLTSVLKLLKT